MIVTVTLNTTVDRVLAVPGFRVGVHAQAELRQLQPSGKGVNVARGLARLGVPAVAMGFVGRDQAQTYVESLAEDGVEAALCTVAGRTRMNTTILDPEARTTTHLREPGFEVDADDLARLRGDLLARLRDSAEPVAVFSGSVPRGMAPEGFADLLVACREAGARVVLDANGPPLRAAVATGVVDTLKPNLLELGQCLGREVAPDEVAEATRELLDRVRTVLVTLGEEGAWLVREGLAIRCRCRLSGSELRNVVGCGDAFMVGWLKGEQEGAGPLDALRRAVAAGAACATTEATVGYTPSDVEAMLPRAECASR